MRTDFNTFGQILDEILSQIGLRQIDITRIYEIEKSSVSTDRATMLTRRRMMKYRHFMKQYGITEGFMLYGEYPIFEKESEEQVKIQKTIDELLAKIERLQAIIEEKSLQVRDLKELLQQCIEQCGDLRKRKN